MPGIMMMMVMMAEWMCLSCVSMEIVQRINQQRRRAFMYVCYIFLFLVVSSSVVCKTLFNKSRGIRLVTLAKITNKYYSLKPNAVDLNMKIAATLNSLYTVYTVYIYTVHTVNIIHFENSWNN